MAKVLLSHNYAGSGIAQNTTRYGVCVAGSNGNVATTESDSQSTFRTAGTLSNLWHRVNTNTTNVTTTIRLRKNTADGNQVLSVGSGSTGSFEDTTNTDSVSVADVFNYSIAVPAGSGTITLHCAGILFNATSNTVNRYGATRASGRSFPGSNQTSNLIIGNGLNTGDSETQNQQQFKTAGTLKNLYVKNISNSRTTTTTVITRKNGANGNLTVSIGSGATGIFEDTSNSDTIADGDLVNFRHSNSTGSQASTYTIVSAEFETTNSKTMFLATPIIFQNANLTWYTSTGYDAAQSTTENNAIIKAGVAMVTSKMRCYVPTNTVTATSTVRFRKSSANGNQSLSIGSSATGSFEDTTNTDSVAATDTINYSVATGATGTQLVIYPISILADMSTPSGLVRSWGYIL